MIAYLICMAIMQAGNVTCNAVCPGYMLTELVEKQLAATAKLRGMSEVRFRGAMLSGSHAQLVLRYTA